MPSFVVSVRFKHIPPPPPPPNSLVWDDYNEADVPVCCGTCAAPPVRRAFATTIRDGNYLNLTICLIKARMRGRGRDGVRSHTGVACQCGARGA